MRAPTLAERLPRQLLSPGQSAALAAMEVQTYVRRRMPSDPQLGAATACAWSETDLQSPLARALAQAVRAPESRAGMHWLLAQGVTLPDLTALRADGRAKREFWRAVRSRMRASPP